MKHFNKFEKTGPKEVAPISSQSVFVARYARYAKHTKYVCANWIASFT